MRIRRRLPLPTSSSPPPHTPDPSLFPVLQPPNKREAAKETGVGGGEGEGLHQDGDLPIEAHGRGMDPINGNPAPSGHHPTTGRSKEWSSTPPFFARPHPILTHAQQVLEEVVKEEEEMVDSSKRWNARVNSDKRIGSSSSTALVSEKAQLGRETVFVPKKRRGGHDGDGNGNGRSEEKPVEKHKTAKTKARAKASCSQVENNCTSADGGDNRGGDGLMVNGNIGSNGKKRRSPAVLMEGSRCSRVNGRGWRCCQQTLVGYSLCEHHLGKGRLRSMSSVRSQASGNKPKKSTEGGGDGVVSSCSPTPQEDEKKASDKQSLGVDNGGEEDMVEEKLQARKKRKKIGTVKARTISSLLDETHHPVPSALSSPSPPLPLDPVSVQSLNGAETVV